MKPLLPSERYVLLTILEEVLVNHKQIIENAGDYDIPSPMKAFLSALEKIRNSPPQS